MKKKTKLSKEEEKEDSIYEEEVMTELLENDEISPEEEAFMRGYTEEY